MEAEVAEGVETVVDAEFFVGEAVVVVNQRPKRLDCLTAAGVDFEAARSSLVEDDGVDAVDFVADFPGGAGCGDLQSSFSEDGVVCQTHAGGFAGGAGGVGADVFAAFQAEAVVDFVGDVPGGGVDHDEFVEDVEVVADSDAEDGGLMLSTLKSRPIQRGAWGMSATDFEMFSSEKLIATSPLRFSKLASNSWRNVLGSSCARAASTSSGGTFPPSMVVYDQRFQSLSSSPAKHHKS